MITRKSCVKCVFYVEEKNRCDDKDGFCVRFPPIPYVKNEYQMRVEGGHYLSEHYSIDTMVPYVHEDFWCGEYKGS